jgi:hypothetical protein
LIADGDHIITRSNLAQADATPLWPGDLRNDGGSVAAPAPAGKEAR